MKALKYFAIAAVLISGLSSCLVVRDSPGHHHPRPPHPHHHHHGHGHGHHGHHR